MSAPLTGQALYFSGVGRTPGHGAERHLFRAFGVGGATSACGDAQYRPPSPTEVAQQALDFAPLCERCRARVIGDVVATLELIGDATTVAILRRRLVAANL